MSPLQESFSVDPERALSFFTEMIGEVVSGKRYDHRQLCYVANILAHYTQVSWSDSTNTTYTQIDLSKYLVSEMFGSTEITDPRVLEKKGSHILLMAGFFRNQISHRYNVNLFDRIGQSCYFGVYLNTHERKRQRFFESFAEVFPFWTQTCSLLSQRLQEERFVVRVQ